MERLLKLYLFFRKSPWLDVLVLSCCTLFVTLPPMSPFRIYDIIKNGKVVRAELTAVHLTPVKNYYHYRFRTKDGLWVSSVDASLTRPEDHRIDYASRPNTIEVRYVPSDPENHWLDFEHGYNVETFWMDYLVENGTVVLVLYVIIMSCIHINRNRRSRKGRKAFGFVALAEFQKPTVTM